MIGSEQIMRLSTLSLVIVMTCSSVQGQRWKDIGQTGLKKEDYDLTPYQILSWKERRMDVYDNVLIYMSNYHWTQIKLLQETTNSSLGEFYVAQGNSSLKWLITMMDDLRLIDKVLQDLGKWNDNMTVTDQFIGYLEDRIDYPAIREKLSEPLLKTNWTFQPIEIPVGLKSHKDKLENQWVDLLISGEEQIQYWDTVFETTQAEAYAIWERGPLSLHDKHVKHILSAIWEYIQFPIPPKQQGQARRQDPYMEEDLDMYADTPRTLPMGTLYGQETTETESVKPDSTIDHPKSVFRPAYGVNFKHAGKIVHGVTDYLIAVAIKLPAIEWGTLVRYYPTLNCRNNNTVWLRNEIMRAECRQTNAIISEENRRARKIYMKVTEIFHHSIPRMLARDYNEDVIPVRPGPLKVRGFEYPDLDGTETSPINFPSTVDPPEKEEESRKIRQAATLATAALTMAPQAIKIGKQAYNIAKQGVKAFNIFRKWNLFERLKEFVERPAKNREKIESIEKGLAALTRKTAQTFGKTMENIRKIKDGLAELQNIAYLIEFRQQLLTMSARRLAIMETIYEDARFLQAGIQQLINGHLDPSIMPTFDFDQLMQYVKADLRLHYPDYEPALSRTGQYYQVSNMKWKYEGGHLFLILPVMVRHRQEKPMDLYRMQIIPMPYFSNPDRPKEEDGRIAYTKLELDHDMLVMDEYRNAPYKSADLADCTLLEGIYYCDDLHLVYVSNIPNCAAAIYHNGNPELISQSCPFKYYHQKIPEPMILDGGNEILIAGSQTQWTMICQDNEEVPKYLDAKPYIIIRRKDLCQCKLVSGEFFLQENLSTCELNYGLKRRGPIHLYYTLNAAVAGGFSENSSALMKTLDGMLHYRLRNNKTQQVSGDMISDVPYELDITDVKVYDTDDRYQEHTLVDSYSATEEIELQDVIFATINDKEMCMEEVDIIHKNQQFNQWFSGKGNYMFGVTFMIALLGVTSCVLIGCMAQQWTRVSFKLHQLRRSLHEAGVFWKATAPIISLPVTEAAGYNTTVLFKFNFTTVMTLVLAQVLIVIILHLLWWFWKRVWQYARSDYTETPLTMLKRTWISQAFDTRNSDLIMQISSANLGRSKEIYITTIPGHPSLFFLRGIPMMRNIFRRSYHWWGDTIYIPWSDIQLYFEDRLVLPASEIPTLILYRRAIDKILGEGDCKIRFLVVHNKQYFVVPRIRNGKRRSALYETMDEVRANKTDSIAPSISSVAETSFEDPAPGSIKQTTGKIGKPMPIVGGASAEMYEHFDVKEPLPLVIKAKTLSPILSTKTLGSTERVEKIVTLPKTQIKHATGELQKQLDSMKAHLQSMKSLNEEHITESTPLKKPYVNVDLHKP